MSQLTTELIVDARHPAVFIEVLDARYQVRASGFGRIEESLPTGLYTVRYMAADAVEESDITLRPDNPVTLEQPRELRFASAAPLELTWTSHEYHQAHAQRLSNAPPLELGNGSHLFIFVRDLDAGGPDHPAQGLSLHRLDGEMLLRVDAAVEPSTDQDEARWAGCHVALDPGSYRLRLQLDQGEAVETAIVACPKWQSQVFLLRQGSRYEVAGQPVLDLAGATQLMARPDQGFEPWFRVRSQGVPAQEAGEDLRLADLARQALALGERAVGTDDLRALLNGKWEDPLLGIYGVHLLLMRPEPDLALAERVVVRLQDEILGGFRHPDVEALAVEIAQRSNASIQTLPLEAPPMLRRSWHVLVRATAEQPSLIASQSLAARIADRLWGDGAWLIWEVPPEVPTQQASENWLTPSIEVARTATSEPRIEELTDRIIIGGLTLFKSDAEPEQEIDEARIDAGDAVTPEVREDHDVQEDVLNSPDFNRVVWRLSADPEAARERLASLDLTALRTAIASLLPELARLLDRFGTEELAQAAELDEVELALLVQIKGSLLSRRRFAPSRDPLALDTLVEQLGLPAERIQSAIAGLLLKFLAMLARY